MKRSEQLEAVQLRRDGVSYREIIHRLGLAKSTLWRWLKAEGLVETQPQRLTQLKRLAQQKGAMLVRSRRLQRTATVIDLARRQIGTLSDRDLWLVGIALYWAEGAKQKVTDVSRGVAFSNSDHAAIQVFMEWLTRICKVPLDDILFDVFLHETADAQATCKFWATQLNLPETTRIRVYWKRHRPRTNRHNTGSTYHGVMRVKARRSTELNRRIRGWIDGLIQGIGESANGRPSDFGSEYPGSIPGSPAHDATRSIGSR